MEYNEPVKKEDENKNWFSYISEKSEEVYKIFKTVTIFSSICYIIYKYTCLKDIEKFYGIPYFYFLNMDIMQDIIYYILTIAMLFYGIISIFISVGIEKNEGSLENSKEKLVIINFPNIFMMILVIFMLFKYKINIFHPLLIYIYDYVNYFVSNIFYTIFCICNYVNYFIFNISYIIYC